MYLKLFAGVLATIRMHIKWRYGWDSLFCQNHFPEEIGQTVILDSINRIPKPHRNNGEASGTDNIIAEMLMVDIGEAIQLFWSEPFTPRYHSFHIILKQSVGTVHVKF